MSQPDHDPKRDIARQPDGGLTDRLRAAEGDVVYEFWEQHRGAIQCIVDNDWAPWLRQREGTDDLMQSIFRTFFRGLREKKLPFEDREELFRLLLGITRHRLAEKARHHRRACRDVGKEVHSPAGSPDPDGPKGRDSGESVPDRIAARELFETLQAEIESLPAKQQRALLLRLEERKIVEIAEEMHISDDMALYHLKKARATLRKRLAACDDQTVPNQGDRS